MGTRTASTARIIETPQSLIYPCYCPPVLEKTGRHGTWRVVLNIGPDWTGPWVSPGLPSSTRKNGRTATRRVDPSTPTTPGVDPYQATPGLTISVGGGGPWTLSHRLPSGEVGRGDLIADVVRRGRPRRGEVRDVEYFSLSRSLAVPSPTPSSPSPLPVRLSTTRDGASQPPPGVRGRPTVTDTPRGRGSSECLSTEAPRPPRGLKSLSVSSLPYRLPFHSLPSLVDPVFLRFAPLTEHPLSYWTKTSFVRFHFHQRNTLYRFPLSISGYKDRTEVPTARGKDWLFR